MSTFTMTTIRASSTLQTGLASNTVVGAASMDAAVSDSSDSSYIHITARAELDTQPVRLKFPTPVLPAGAKVFSIGIRDRKRSVVLVTPSSPVPLCRHWLRCTSGTVQVAGQVQNVDKTGFNVDCPSTTTTAGWVDEDFGQFATAPGNAPWDASTGGNLDGLTLDLGRGDDLSSAVDISAVYVDVYYQQLSTVTITGPTGTVTSTRPTVTWAYASPNFAPQRGYRVAVYTQAQTTAGGFVPFVTPAQYVSGVAGNSADTSWWLLGADQQWVLPGDLTDGIYVAYVQATATWAGAGGDFTTAIASSTWTRSAAAASPPPAAVLQSVTYDRTTMRVPITFIPGGSSPATTAATVQRSDDGGVTWTASPSLTLIPVSGTGAVTVYDRFAPLNTLCTYRVIAYSGSVFVAATAPSNTLTVTRQDDRPQLHHPTNDLLDTDIVIKAPKSDEGLKVTLRQMSGTFYLTGGAGGQVLPIMTWGPTYGREYDLTLWFHMLENPDMWAAVDQLNRAGCPLYFQLPTGDSLWIGMGPGSAGRDTEDNVNVVPGDITTYAWKRRKVTFTEIQAPAFY